jgi:hypothetical protein
VFYGVWAAVFVVVLGLSRGAPARELRPEAAVASAPARVVALPPKPEGAASAAVGEGARYSEADCRSRPEELRGYCFKVLAQQRAPEDLEGALLACAELPAGEPREECLSDVADLRAATDLPGAAAVCADMEPGRWADQCVFGLALRERPVDPRAAFVRCDGAGRFRDFCRHDVNGEIAVVDIDLALSHCAAEEGDLLTRKSCWHGLGKYLARVDVDRAFAACARVPRGPDGLYRENCIHGLGWGAAESAGQAFAQRCGEAGPERDSCLLGVAYNLRRFEPEAAVALCGSAERADLRARCLEFVRRPPR